MTAIHSNNVLDTSLQSYVDSLDRTACHENRLRSDMRDASIALAHIAQLIKDMGDQQLLINVAMQVDPATRDSVLPAMDDEPSTKPLHPNSLTASACTTAQLIAENGASFSVPFSLVRTHSSRLAKELWAKISAGQKPVVQLDVSETALNRMVQCWQSIRTGRNGFASPLQDYLEQPSFARKLRVNPDQYASLVHQLARRIGNTTWTESKDRPSLLQQIWKLELPQLDAWELRKAGMERLLARQGIFDDPMVYDVQWLDNNIHIEGRLCPDENDESLLSNPVQLQSLLEILNDLGERPVIKLPSEYLSKDSWECQKIKSGESAVQSLSVAPSDEVALQGVADLLRKDAKGLKEIHIQESSLDLAPIFEGLKVNTNLEALHFSYSKPEQAQALLDALADNAKSGIRTLKLKYAGGKPAQTLETAPELQIAPHTMRKLHALSIDYASVKEDAWASILEKDGQGSSLERLHLRFPADVELPSAFQEAEMGTVALKELTIEGLSLPCIAMQVLSRGLASVPSLNKLSLKCSPSQNRDCKIWIGDFLSKNESVEELHLHGARFTMDEVLELTRGLGQNFKLQKLYLDDDSMGYAEQQRLDSFLSTGLSTCKVI